MIGAWVGAVSDRAMKSDMRIPPTMRAVVLRGRASVALETVPVPVPGPGQLLARVDAAGICASLIKTIDQGSDHPYFYSQDLGAFPAILGDEGSVTLVRVGRALQDRYDVGDRFVVQPAVDHAPINHRDRYRGNGAGIAKIACGYTLPGLLAQYILIPEEVLLAHCLVPLPGAAIPHAHAAIAEPLSCCLSGQEHHMHLEQDGLRAPRRALNGLKKGGVTVIVGLGSMGRMHADIALAGGVGAVLCSDPLKRRRKKARALFANRAQAAAIRFAAVAPATLARSLAEVSSGAGADDLIIAVGAAEAIEESLPLLAKGGAASIFGGLQTGCQRIRVDANAIHYGETCISGSSGGTAWDLAQTVEWLAEETIDAGSHIVRIGGMTDAMQLIDDVRHNRLEGKAVVYPHRAVDHAFEVDGWTAQDEAGHLS